MFPSKFVPKVPVKKEKDSAEVAVGAPSKPATSEPSQTKKDQPRRKDYNKDRDRGDRGGRNGNDQRERGGRGQWVMPTGVAFFTGNAPAQLASNVKNLTLPVKSVKQEVGRVARPNECIENFETVSTTLMDKKKPAENEYQMQVADESDDSDATVQDDDDRPFDDQGRERWPPTRYDPYSPLSLPFGPRTALTRKLLASESILANPHDPEALIQEEQSSLFVLQMPSDLRFENILGSTNTASAYSSSSSASAEESKAGSSAGKVLDHRGKLGRLRLHASGRVTLLVTTTHSSSASALTGEAVDEAVERLEERMYEVKTGLASSFLQCLSAIHTPTESTTGIPAESTGIHAASVPVTNTGITSSSSAGNKKGKKTTGPGGVTGTGSGTGNGTGNADGPVAVGLDGSVHFLGNITKKLVLTPCYELGNRKAKHGNTGNTSGILSSLVEEEEGVVAMEE